MHQRAFHRLIAPAATTDAPASPMDAPSARDAAAAAAAAAASPSPSPLPTALPASPRVHAGCCLALGSSLLAHLAALLPPPPRAVLSIGSGHGLLEALLVRDHAVNLAGVEVHPSPNRFLPAARHQSVAGTRCLSPLAAAADAWLFVYPRCPDLLLSYLAQYGEAGVHTIVWVGPKADWDDYRPCFGPSWHVEAKDADQGGGKAWELIAHATKA